MPQSDWLLHVQVWEGVDTQFDWLLNVSGLGEVWMSQSDWLLNVPGLGEV